MLPKPGGSSKEGSGGDLSLANLAGPLPILTLPLGREPCLDTQEVMVVIADDYWDEAGIENNRGARGERRFSTEFQVSAALENVFIFCAPLPPVSTPPTIHILFRHLTVPQFSVSFPSGIRRASSLTSSLALRLGPSLLTEKAPDGTISDDEKGGGRGQGGDGDIVDSGTVRSVRLTSCFDVRPAGRTMV